MATEPFVLAVNGQAARIEAAPATPLSAIVADAILLTGNERWGGVERWECRNSRGELLDDSTALGAIAPNQRGVSVWIQLKPGVFA
jgi:hypothetical protein